MTALFLYLTRLSLRACVIIPLIILIRFLIKNQPKFYSYLLWVGVFICLVADMKMLGVNFVTPVSAVQSELLYRYEEVLDDYVGESEIHHHNSLEYYEAINRGVKPVFDLESKAQYVVTQKDTVKPATTVLNLLPFYAKIWFAVVIVLCMLVLKSSFEIYSKIKNAIHYEKNIYLVKDIPSPFVFGIIKPKIYIPENLAIKDLSYIIAHEQCHINRGDYLLKPMWLFVTLLHWFNPLVWTAYRMFCRDMEMSCDENVIESLGGSSKKPYSALLLDFATDTSLNATVLFGESNAESRIKNVLNFKKPTTVIAVLLGVVAFAAMVLPMISNPVKLMSPITEAPETFYEQLDRVNDIDRLQYKYRMGAEGSPPRQWAHDTYIDGGLPLYSIPENTPLPGDIPPVPNGSDYSTYIDCLGTRLDDGGKFRFSMAYKNRTEAGRHRPVEIYNYTDGVWQEKIDLDLGGQYEDEVLKSHDRLYDDYYITVLMAKPVGMDFHRPIFVHTKNGVSEIVTVKSETQPAIGSRSIRFLNEKVGFGVGRNEDEKFPHAFVTLDGGETWKELDFTRLVPEGLKTVPVFDGCITNIYGEVIELRYHAWCEELGGNSPADNYSIISTDGGLTWTGYRRDSAGQTIGKTGFDYITKTETIPVMLLDRENNATEDLPGTYIENTEFDWLVKDIIRQYKNDTAEISENFMAMPEDFLFPEIIEDLKYIKDEMGFWNTTISSADYKYTMGIMINTSSYGRLDGTVDIPPPRIISVGFYKTSTNN